MSWNTYFDKAGAAEFRLTPRDLAYWDAFAACFRADAGEYAILAGGSSVDTPAGADIVLAEGKTMPENK